MNDVTLLEEERVQGNVIGSTNLGQFQLFLCNEVEGRCRKVFKIG